MPGESPAPGTLLLIDGHALVFRAFFAMPALTNSRGEMTNAVFGFTSMLLKVLGEHTPDHAIACFDPPGPTFRHQEFADYKAQRPPMPSELARQLPLCREVIEALGIPQLEVSGYEADDVIGALSRQAEAAGVDVLILTGDLDALQLVTPHVRVYATRRGITETIVYDVARVEERYGFAPPQVVDFKALQGDVSDNIPGVPGIGEKTAKQLVAEHGPLEAILEAVPSMKEGRVKRALSEHADQARLSKRMATIVSDLPVELDLDAARLRGYDRERVLRLFDELEFRSLIVRLPAYMDGDAAARASGAAGAGAGAAGAQAALPLLDAGAFAPRLVVIESRDQAREAAARLRDAPAVAIRSLLAEPARRGRLAGVGLAPVDDPRVAFYLALGHEAPERNASDEAVAVIGELLGDPALRLSGYDLKRELLAWRARGVRLGGFDLDLLLAAYLTNTRERTPSMTLLASDTIGVDVEADEVLLGSGRARRVPAAVPVAEAARQAGRWAAAVGPLRTALVARMGESLRGLHDQMELPLVPILAEMEALGICVDPHALGVLSRELGERIAALESEVHDVAGYTFNLGSTQQLARFLYEDLALAAGRRTKTGRSTDADTLEALREENPVVGLVLEWRQLTKLRGTYVDALPLLCEPDGRVHTSFNQAVAATGRLSSSDPNLQNIPIRTEWGRRVRSAFAPDRPGDVLVSADYSQIELRVLAHVSGDGALIDAFQSHEDIHARTAAEVAGVAREAVTPLMRRNAKVVNFGVVYGLSDFGLARDTGMSQEEAHAFIAAYFERFAAVRGWLEQTRNQAREWGFVETLFGRRRYIPDIRAANRAIRLAAERMAVNMPIQGAAADIMKLAMIRAHRRLDERGLRARLLLQVHDELVLEAPESEVEELAELLVEAMSGAAQLIVPLDVDVKIGPNWDAMTPLAVAAPAAGAAQ